MYKVMRVAKWTIFVLNRVTLKVYNWGESAAFALITSANG